MAALRADRMEEILTQVAAAVRVLRDGAQPAAGPASLHLRSDGCGLAVRRRSSVMQFKHYFGIEPARRPLAAGAADDRSRRVTAPIPPATRPSATSSRYVLGSCSARASGADRRVAARPAGECALPRTASSPGLHYLEDNEAGAELGEALGQYFVDRCDIPRRHQPRGCGLARRCSGCGSTPRRVDRDRPTAPRRGDLPGITSALIVVGQLTLPAPITSVQTVVSPCLIRGASSTST